MKNLFLAILLLAPTGAFAAKRVSQRFPQYLPVFGVGSTGSVAYSGTSGQTIYWNPTGGGQTTLLRIITTSAAYISQGSNPTATANDIYLPANTELILEVLAGYRIAALQASGPGRLFATEILTFPSAD